MVIQVQRSAQIAFVTVLFTICKPPFCERHQRRNETGGAFAKQIWYTDHGRTGKLQNTVEMSGGAE